MGAKERPYSSGFFDRKTTRRTLLRNAAKLGGSLALLGTLRGVTLDPNTPPEYQPATPQERQQLTEDGISTIAHRAGNSENGIRNAARAGIDFADGDLNKIGKRLYLYHGTQLGPLGIDIDTKGFKLGVPDLTIERAFQVAGEEQIGMFLEFKRGNFAEEDAKHIYSLARNHEVKLYLSSRDIEIVRMAYEAIGDPSVCLFNPYNEEDWNKFLGETSINRILTTRYWFERYQPELESRKTEVIISGINSFPTAASIAATGMIHGFMNETRVLQEVFRNPRN